MISGCHLLVDDHAEHRESRNTLYIHTWRRDKCLHFNQAKCLLSLILDRMYQSSCVFASSIGYVGGPGSGTAMLVVGLLVLAEWRAPNGVKAAA